ncbi:MAG: RnfABCDGE type electron transport complex subunit G [Pseudoflavonifractor sp.]|nr:RnfABCDGE type electron transport complex subunit G [Pseudoflavonifractor sp.]
MKRVDSTPVAMIASLGGVTILAAAILAAVYALTAGPIKESQRARQIEAIGSVMPAFDNDPVAEVVTMDDGTTIYPGHSDGHFTGAAVESSSENGFSGRITVIYGFAPDGEVTGYSVVSHAETPGLGARMDTWFADPQGSRSVIGRNPATTSMYVTKDPGGEIDAITAATITSRAFLEALRKAHASFQSYTKDHE